MKIVWSEVPERRKDEKHVVRQLDCGDFYFVIHKYDAGWSDESHQHLEAQFGHVLKGSMQVYIEGKEVTKQESGQAVFIRSMVKHRSEVPTEQTIALNLYLKKSTTADE
jgi:mannose-6-phosphate isomerase-like protein (cupin superfamily)